MKKEILKGYKKLLLLSMLASTPVAMGCGPEAKEPTYKTVVFSISDENYYITEDEGLKISDTSERIFVSQNNQKIMTVTPESYMIINDPKYAKEVIESTGATKLDIPKVNVKTNR